MLGVRQDTTKKGTTVTNNYQKNTPKTSAGPGLAVPDGVTIAMGEIADDMREGALAGEVPVPAYDLFSGSEILGQMAMTKMLGGLSSRRYQVGLEPVGQKVERAASGTSKSAVSRRS